MTGTKIKIDYLNEVYEIVKVRKVNDNMNVVDFKDSVGNIGTVSTRICKTIDGEELSELIKKKELS